MKREKRSDDIEKERRKEFIYYCISAVLITIFMSAI